MHEAFDWGFALAIYVALVWGLLWLGTRLSDAVDRWINGT